MPVPKKRVSRSRRDMRRAHDFLTRTYSIVCPNCGDMTLPHHACPSCGQYRGKQIAKTKEQAASAS